RLRGPAGMREGDLTSALRAVLDHQDGWRLRLEAAGEGEWKLEVAPAGAVVAGACLRRIDIGGLDAAGREACIWEHARAAESRLLPAAGVAGAGGGVCAPGAGCGGRAVRHPPP